MHIAGPMSATLGPMGRARATGAGVPGPGALFGGSLVLWLKDPGLADGASVATWPDSSGSGNAPVASSTPIYKAGILNGRGVVRFDGTMGDFLDSPWSPSGSLTFWVVRRLASLAGLQLPLSCHRSSPLTGGFWYGPYDATTSYYIQSGLGGAPSSWVDGVSATFGVPDTAWHVDMIEFAAGGTTATIDGTVALSDPAHGAIAIGHPLRIGGNADVPSDWLSADIAEVVAVTRGVTSGEQAAMVAYFHARFGL